MISKYLKTYKDREVIYNVGELLSLSLTAFCFSSAILGYRWRVDDHGIALITAILLGLCSTMLFLVFALIRAQDKKG